MKDFVAINGRQWMLYAVNGNLGLYKSTTYNGLSRGSVSWGVDFNDNNGIRTFADYPSFKRLVKNEWLPIFYENKKWRRVNKKDFE